MFELTTERLRLIPLDLEGLQLLKKNRTLMEQHLGLNPSHMVVSPEIQFEIDDALDNVWLVFVAQHPHDYAWGTSWEIVLKTENRSIGGIGVIGLPDEQGETMTGYNIDNNYQNRGYASEALHALMQWVFQHPDMKTVIAETPKDNFPSQRVLQKAGFVLREEKEHTFVWALQHPKIKTHV